MKVVSTAMKVIISIIVTYLIFTREGRGKYFDGQRTTAVRQERIHGLSGG